MDYICRWTSIITYFVCNDGTRRCETWRNKQLADQSEQRRCKILCSSRGNSNQLMPPGLWSFLFHSLIATFTNAKKDQPNQPLHRKSAASCLLVVSFWWAVSPVDESEDSGEQVDFRNLAVKWPASWPIRPRNNRSNNRKSVQKGEKRNTKVRCPFGLPLLGHIGQLLAR